MLKYPRFINVKHSKKVIMNLYTCRTTSWWAIFFLTCALSFTSLSSATVDEADSRAALITTIAYNFKDPKLLELALTHHSGDLGESVSARGNERLEFLGDAVLDYVMKVQILERSYGSQLAILNDTTALLTRNEILVKVADAIGLPIAAMLPTSLRDTAKPGKLSALEKAKADLVEALIGAIYLDSDSISPVETLIRRFWFSAEAPEDYSHTVLSPKPEEDVIGLGYRFKAVGYLFASLGQPVLMESIGISILKFTVNEFLYRRFPELPEGELAKKSALLHATKNIAALPFLGIKAQALVGGVYFDGGLSIAKQFILWHWTSPNAPEEMRAAVYKAHNTVLSGSSVIYPAYVKVVTPKTLLLEVLKPLGKTPGFDTKEVPTLLTPKFVSKVILEEDEEILSKEIDASTKKEAERLAAQDALERLSVRALVDLDSTPALPLDSYLRVLEGFLISKGITFEYHQLAEHPSGRGVRLEVQGRSLIPIITEGSTRIEAQYHSLGYSILQRLENELTSFQTFPAEHRLELNDWLRFYKRYTEEKLQKMGCVFEVIPMSKAKEKKTPLLTYKIDIPERSVSVEGLGYSADEATLDALIQTLKQLQLVEKEP